MQATVPESSSSAVNRPRRGRPRDPGLDRAILDSAFSLMVETGIRAFSVREVARRSGIPKSSIYRRWATRAELLTAVMSRLSTGDAEVPNTGNLRDDLAAIVRREITALESSGAALPRVALEARDDPELAPAVRDVLKARRHALSPVLQRAVDRGELPRDVDFEVVVDVVLGPVWSRLIAHRPLTPGDADQLVGCALDGLRSLS